jgi:LysR family transcriptional regulator, cell division regulator
LILNIKSDRADMPQALDLAQIATFSEVARQGSISAAAAALHTVQSNVTARVRQLEASLGVALFTRHRRGVTPTAAGERLLVYAARLQSLADEARMAVGGAIGTPGLAAKAGPALGSLSIGSMETTAAVRLPGLLARFHADHPDVQIDIRTGPTADLLEQVLHRRLDAAFVAGPVAHPELQADPCFAETLVLVRARADTAKSPPTRAIVFRPGCSYRQRLETLFTERGWLPLRRLEFGTLEGVLGCVGAGVGVTVLPESAAAGYRHAESLQLQALPARLARVHTLLVRRTDTPVSPALSAWNRVVHAKAPSLGR